MGPRSTTNDPNRTPLGVDLEPVWDPIRQHVFQQTISSGFRLESTRDRFEAQWLQTTNDPNRTLFSVFP
jgi:hypothetical protein